MAASRKRQPQTRENVLFLLKQATHYAQRAVDDAIRDQGITAAQLGVLTRLAQRPGMSGADLARELLFTPQAAQLAIASLERRGLVQRTQDPNHGRILRTQLTVKGRRVIDNALEDAYATQDKLLSIMTAQEQRTMTDLLERFISQAEHPNGAAARSKRAPRS